MANWKVIAEENGGLFPIFFMFEALNEQVHKVLGVVPDDWVLKSENHEWELAVDMDNWEELAFSSYDLLKSDKQFLSKIRNKIIFGCNSMVKVSEKIHNENLSKLSNNELWCLFQEYRKANKDMYTWGMIPVFIDFEVTRLSDDVRELIKKKLKDNPNKQLFTEYFIALTTPGQESSLRKEEKSFLGIAGLICNNPKALELFNKDISIIKQGLNKFPVIDEEINIHIKEFSCTGYVYLGPAWSKGHYLDLLSSYSKQDIDPGKKLKEFVARDLKLKHDKKRIFAELDFSVDELHLINCAKEFGFLKLFRKDALYKSYFHLHSWLEEVGKRFNLTVTQLRHMLPEEIEHLLRFVPHSEILDKRKKYYLYTLQNQKLSIFHDKQAKDLFEKNVVKTKIPVVDELRGNCSCQGRAVGAVKLIRTSDDMKKMQRGDILISPATNPNLVPAMSKASAIVTDEGGITCHAAIVSRELGVPCITGTKFVTKVFKDGDMVEVDATKGIIKRLKRDINFDNLFCMEDIPDTNFLLLTDSLKSMANDFSKLGIPNVSPSIFTFCKGSCKLVFDKDNFCSTGKIILSKMINVPDWFEDLNNSIVKYSKIYLSFVSDLRKIDFSSLSDDNLSFYLKKFLLLKSDVHFFGLPAVVLDYEFNHFTNFLIDYLKDNFNDIDVNDVFRILTTPTKMTLALEEEESLLRIALKIKSNPDLLKLFLDNDLFFVEENISGFNDVSDDLTRHFNSFCWLNFMYNGPAYKMDYFLQRLKILIASDPVKELDGFNQRFKDIKTKQLDLVGSLGIDYEHARLFKFARETVFLKSYRKDCLYFGFFVVHSLMEEISSRFDIGLDYVKCISQDDIDDLFSNKLTENDLKKRFDCCAYVFKENDLSILFDDSVKKIIDSVDVEVKEVDEVVGQSACAGIARGHVKIINTKQDLQKMNNGDILVSISTNPDLVPAMSKASAIVADMGGITCHAAIVAREMDIPCIIGAKIATKAFKDNDFVEVDANKGVIRRVENNDEYTQISKRGRVSPFPNCFSMEAITSVMNDVIGYSYDKIMLVFEDRMGNFFFDKASNERVKGLALDKAKNDPKIMKKLIKKVEDLGAKFVEFTKQISESDLSEKSNKELFDLYKKYYDDYKVIYAHYFVILSMENSVMDFLRNYLVSLNIDEGLRSQYLSSLTTSTRAMYPKEEEKDLLILAVDISENNLSQKEIDEKIKEHTDKFFWLTRDYEDPVLSEKDFFDKLNNLNQENIKEKLLEIENFYVVKEQEISRVLNLLEIDDFHSQLFELLRDGIYLKELRKRFVSESLFYMDSLLSEIGKRTSLSLKQLRFLLSSDVEDLLLNNVDYDVVADQRIELSAYLSQDGKTTVFVGEEAKKIKSDLIKIPVDIKKLKGVCVSPGKYKGRVKIVLDPSDIYKVEPGDIMVTVQAVPSFTPAIKIAGAMTADGGTGITSHPATLAREAGIPCVTGLKIAVDILKDGDIIEVDADNGVVKLK